MSAEEEHCLRCGKYIAKNREDWHDDKDRILCHCVYPRSSHKNIPKDWRQQEYDVALMGYTIPGIQ